MIKQKVGICPECGPDSKQVPLIAGKCQTHYWKGRQDVNKRKKSVRTTESKLTLIEPTALGLWFKYHIDHNTWVCENCGDPISHYTSTLAYAAQAHILPKAIFLTVRTHLDNHLTLCSIGSRNNCHGAFDASWERASRMPVFGVAKIKLLKFYHLLSEREMSRLPEVFQKLISQV